VSGETAYPLAWPDGWPRTPAHERDAGTQFRTAYQHPPHFAGGSSYRATKPVTFDIARKKLAEELERLKATNIVLSTNIPLRLDGLPRASARLSQDDPGVAVYFTFKGKQMTMAQDRFDSIAANMRSLGLAIEAMRSLERHGGGTMMERAFDGFAALPPPGGAVFKRPWWQVLGYSNDAEERRLLSVDEVTARYRTLVKQRHPDNGGSAEAFTELTEARDEAVRALG
jgi:hypothetical protein